MDNPSALPEGDKEPTMEKSSQQEQIQPSQHELSKGLPLDAVREHLHDVAPLSSELQGRLDAIEKQNFGEAPK